MEKLLKWNFIKVRPEFHFCEAFTRDFLMLDHDFKFLLGFVVVHEEYSHFLKVICIFFHLVNFFS